MKATQLVGIVLIVLGVLALIYGGFTYTEETHDVGVGPLELEVKEQERVNIPAWGGAASLVVGLVLVVAGKRS